MPKNLNNKYQLFAVFLAVLILPQMVFASEISFDSEIKEIGVGQQFSIDVILDTENEEINAVEGKIIFPDEFLELKEIRDGNSIVNFWVKRPQSDSPGKIIFSGITPGGYRGKKGLLFSIIFQAKKTGEVNIEFHDVRVLKNDGLGTPAEVQISNFQFSISNQLPVSQTPTSQAPIAQMEDKEPPETFQPKIGRDETMFENKWFLVFATQDKNSGIDHYEIQENRKQKIESRKWVKAESPYLLKDQKLRSYIYVKAVDKADNERIAVVEPKYPMKWYESWLVWAIIMVIVAGVIWNLKFIIRK